MTIMADSAPRILIVGCGGVGGYFGGRLALKNRLCFLCREGAHYDALRIDGLELEDGIHGEHIKVKPLPRDASLGASDGPDPSALFTTSLDGLSPFDVVVLTTKLVDFGSGNAELHTLAPYVAADAVVFSLQNGVEATEMLASAFGERVVSAQCFISSFKKEAGKVHCITGNTKGSIAFGERRASEAFAQGGSASERCKRLQANFVSCNTSCVVPEDMDIELWRKFVLSSTYGLFALGRLPFKIGCVVPETRAVILAAMRETIAVAAAANVSLPDKMATDFLELLSKSPVAVKCSTLRDVEANKPSEIEDLCGSVIRLGAKAVPPVPTPTHAVVLALSLPRERQLRGEIEDY